MCLFLSVSFFQNFLGGGVLHCGAKLKYSVQSMKLVESVADPITSCLLFFPSFVGMLLLPAPLQAGSQAPDLGVSHSATVLDGERCGLPAHLNSQPRVRPA